MYDRVGFIDFTCFKNDFNLPFECISQFFEVKITSASYKKKNKKKHDSDEKHNS